MIYRCILLDCPWPERGGGRRGADMHYPVMSKSEIIRTIYCSGVWDPANNAHLWSWTTDNYLKDALFVMEALGFRYVRTMAWHKGGRFGLGQYLRGAHELCLFGVRGRLSAMARDQPSAFDAPKRAHSQKPDESYSIIEKVSPGPRLEMFARSHRPGWDSWGDEVDSAT